MKTSTKVVLGLVVAYFLFARKGRAQGLTAMNAGTSDAAQFAIRLAQQQVGLKESPRGSNRGPQIEKFTGGRAEPWCGHFVAWIFRTIGKPLPGDRVPSPGAGGENPRAGVTATEQTLKDKGLWLPPSATPAPADIVFYATRGAGDSVPGRHVGLVVGVTPTTIETVEGNWGDGVAKLTTARSSPRITGYGRVV